MSIDSIGSVGTSATDFAAFRKQLFQKSDTNGNGTLNQDELTASLKNAPKPPGADAANAPDSTKVFQSLDTNGDGQVTEEEMDAGFADKAAQTKSAPPPSGGAAPSGGSGKTSGSTGSSSSNKTYDKMDANKNGTVTAQEEFEYKLKHPESVDASQATSKTTNADGTGHVLNTKA